MFQDLKNILILVTIDIYFTPMKDIVEPGIPDAKNIEIWRHSVF